MNLDDAIARTGFQHESQVLLLERVGAHDDEPLAVLSGGESPPNWEGWRRR